MATAAAALDLAAIKRRQQQVWASGDYGQIGHRLTIMAESLCEAVDLRPGQRVLDVATGTGITAIAAARRFCDVTGVDYVPALLERARERAEAERLSVAFREADAEQLPFPDASFDAVLSTVGVMFTPNQEQAARELLRVCRAGGKIGLANWTPDGFVGGMLRTFAGHAPPPAGLNSPVLWGTEDRLRQLLGAAVAAMKVSPRSFVFRFPSPEQFVSFFRAYYGPAHKAFETLDASGQAGLMQDLLDLVGKFNQANDGTMIVPAAYLEVVATRR